MIFNFQKVLRNKYWNTHVINCWRFFFFIIFASPCLIFTLGFKARITLTLAAMVKFFCVYMCVYKRMKRARRRGCYTYNAFACEHTSSQWQLKISHKNIKKVIEWEREGLRLKWKNTEIGIKKMGNRMNVRVFNSNSTMIKFLFSAGSVDERLFIKSLCNCSLRTLLRYCERQKKAPSE